MKNTGNRERGFSLIEVIIVLTLTALLSTFIYSFFGRSYFESMKAGDRLAKAHAIQTVMENIISDYKKNFTTNLPGLQTKITNNSPSYGQYTVVENVFGDFDVTTSNWVNGGGPVNRLKVTIKNELGETLTIVFSPQ